jgi:tetratricopeptide (TPR) repeat protein
VNQRSTLDRNKETFELYSKILARKPVHLGALVNKGLLCKIPAILSKRYNLYTTALEHHPDDTDVLINIGNITYKMKSFESAGEYYARVVEIDPGTPTGWYN